MLMLVGRVSCRNNQTIYYVNKIEFSRHRKKSERNDNIIEANILIISHQK